MDPSIFDENGYFHLDINIPESDDDISAYSADHFNSTCLFSGGRVPDIEVIQNTSKLRPAVQKILNEYFGKNVVKAGVVTAVSADIDGDGKMETLVNSDNNSKAKYDNKWGGWDEEDTGDYDEEDIDNWDEEETDDYAGDDLENWYSLCFMIDDDSSVKIIGEYHDLDTLDFSCILFAQNIIDIDGDGVCEIIVSWETYETYGTEIYKYDGNDFNSVMYYITGC